MKKNGIRLLVSQEDVTPIYIHDESYGAKELPDGNNVAEYVNQTNDDGFVIFTDSDTVGVMKQHNFGLMKLMPER